MWLEKALIVVSLSTLFEKWRSPFALYSFSFRYVIWSVTFYTIHPLTNYHINGSNVEVSVSFLDFNFFQKCDKSKVIGIFNIAKSALTTNEHN